MACVVAAASLADSSCGASSECNSRLAHAIATSVA
jgi:hypothetical protein